MAIVGQLMVLVGVNNAPLTAGLAASQAQLKGFAGVGSAALNVVKTAAIGIGVATVAGAAFGIKAAADFEDAFAGVRKTVNEADLAAAGLTFEDLARQFRDMATEIPVAATELAAIGEAAGALGIRAEDIDEFTRTVALLGATTNLTTADAAEALGKVGTILDLTGSEFQDFADILVNLGNQGASTESEIIEITRRFAGAGKMAGLTTDQILALASSVSSLGINEEAGGSALSRIFGNMGTEIANNSKKGEALSRVIAGVFDDIEKADAAGGGSHILGDFDKSADATRERLLGLVDQREGLPILLEFLQALNQLGPSDQLKALKDVGIRNVNDRNAIIVMAQNLPFVNEQLAIAEDSMGALGIEAEKRFDTFNSRLTLLGNNFNELLITVGTPLLPIASDFVLGITRAIQNLAASGQVLTTTFSPIVSAIVERFQTMLPTIQAVADAVMDFASRVWEGGLNKALQTGATVIGSIVDVLGGLATAIVTNQDVMNILRTTADLIGTGFGLASTAVSNLLTFLGQLGDAIRNNEELMRTLAGIGDAIAAGFVAAGPAIDAAISAIGRVVELAGIAFDEILKLAGGGPPGISDMRNPDRNEGVPVARGADPLGTIGDALGGAGDWIFRGGKAPIQINSTTTVVLDGEKVGSVTDRRLYNNASQYSSGFGGELR